MPWTLDLRQFSLPIHGSPHSLQLGDPKLFEQTGLGIEGPIERADAALLVAGDDPVNQFLIAELIAVAQAVINIAAIDLSR